jgi:hypothetical protein
MKDTIAPQKTTKNKQKNKETIKNNDKYEYKEPNLDEPHSK